MELAIDVVVEARSEELTAFLLGFLRGDSDGVQKDARHLYRLHLGLGTAGMARSAVGWGPRYHRIDSLLDAHTSGNYDEAARAADVEATQQQRAGEYAAAHATLHRAIRALEGAGASASSATLLGPFHLLHSYMLAKRLIHHNDHRGAARLLLRVARRIARFPAHAVPILTSAVIESQRAELPAPAFQYVSLLVTDPTYRQELDPQLRRKFETIVRRGVGAGGKEEDEEEEEDKEDDGAAGPVPMCIASGRYMTAKGAEAADGIEEAWCICPNSGMPALLVAYRRFIDAEAALAADGVARDPVCTQSIRKADLVRISAADILQRKSQRMKR